jgi:hypothetical protein
VDEIYDTMVDAIVNKKLENEVKEIKKETPLPMNTMLDKQPRSEAIKKKQSRESMPIVDVPPTNPGRLFNSKKNCCNYSITFHLSVAALSPDELGRAK